MEIESSHIHVVRYDEVPSTNLIALEFGEQGTPDGTVIQALQQTGGRGRLGRSFCSPPGGLYFSLVLRPKNFSSHLPLLTLAAGVFCSTLIEKISGENVKLKWPNDIYLANRKLGGILTEAAPYSYRAGTIPFLVVGIGLNINTRIELFDDSLRDTVISLYSVQKRVYDLDALMSDIAVQLRQYVHDSPGYQNEILAEWKMRDYLSGKPISWQKAAAEKMIHGTGAGILEDGRYVLRTEEGRDLPIIGGELRVNKSE